MFNLCFPHLQIRQDGKSVRLAKHIVGNLFRERLGDYAKNFGGGQQLRGTHFPLETYHNMPFNKSEPDQIPIIFRALSVIVFGINVIAIIKTLRLSIDQHHANDRL